MVIVLRRLIYEIPNLSIRFLVLNKISDYLPIHFLFSSCSITYHSKQSAMGGKMIHSTDCYPYADHYSSSNYYYKSKSKSHSQRPNLALTARFHLFNYFLWPKTKNTRYDVTCKGSISRDLSFNETTIFFQPSIK